MLRRLLSIGLLAALAPYAPAGAGAAAPPVLPEVRQHLVDGWACLEHDPEMARAHAMAVLVSPDVTVELSLDRVGSSRKTSCRAVVDEALEAWEQALDHKVRLRRVDDGGRSGIVIRFQPEVREKGEPVAGYVNWKRSAGTDGGGVTGDVQVRTMNLDGTPMPPRAMRHIVIHEIGHLLGLDDTGRTGDAMGPLDVSRPVSAPTSAEAAAVRNLRAEAERLLQDAR